MTRDRFDRAAIVLGGGAVLSLVFALTTSSNNNFVKVQGVALLIFPLFGLVAVLGGLTGRRPVVLASGVLFVLSGVLQLVQFGHSINWIGGNGSTFALLLAFGIGLLVVATAKPTKVRT